MKLACIMSQKMLTIFLQFYIHHVPDAFETDISARRERFNFQLQNTYLLSLQTFFFNSDSKLVFCFDWKAVKYLSSPKTCCTNNKTVWQMTSWWWLFQQHHNTPDKYWCTHAYSRQTERDVNVIQLQRWLLCRAYLLLYLIFSWHELQKSFFPFSCCCVCVFYSIGTICCCRKWGML